MQEPLRGKYGTICGIFGEGKGDFRVPISLQAKVEKFGTIQALLHNTNLGEMLAILTGKWYHI